MVNERSNPPTGRARILRALAVTATVEAITWAGLLVGMVFKRVLDVTELGVEVFGPLHGAAFLAYCLSAVLTWRVQRWSAATGLLALVASLPPFGTVVFHRWAQRTGRLSDQPDPASQDAIVGTPSGTAPSAG